MHRALRRVELGLAFGERDTQASGVSTHCAEWSLRERCTHCAELNLALCRGEPRTALS